jgi:hypothetical protein
MSSPSSSSTTTVPESDVNAVNKRKIEDAPASPTEKRNKADGESGDVGKPDARAIHAAKIKR